MTKGFQSIEIDDKYGKINPRILKILGLVIIGIFLRYIVMAFGYNYDFESYTIVGEISGNLRNVYTETSRYNYAPLFMFIQGTLYRLSLCAGTNQILMYRVLIVTTLTLTDICIAAFISYRYSITKALLFFLNPVSIIITGYHSQFDNIAVLFALLSITFFNEENNINKKDIAFVAVMSFSLITKHILFIFPVFILLMRKIPLKKKCLYSLVPPISFLLSFVPFALGNEAAFQGIMNNVFLYRSFNNAPLLNLLYELTDFPSSMRFIVYVAMMLALACFVRNMPYDRILFTYLIALVSFSSAMTNQYLAIPMAALCVLDITPLCAIYMVMMGVFLILHGDGLNFITNIYMSYGEENLLTRIATFYVISGYTVAAWILFATVVLLVLRNSSLTNEK